jgi:resuscitation-promoting factor RpfB
MDQDGSNARRVYPPPGENSFFPRESQSLAWSPDGQSLAFIFNNQVVLFDLAGGGAQIVSQGDGRRSHLTWAPYGTAVDARPSPAS